MEISNLKILCFLYRNRVISKEEFFETIWHTQGQKIFYYINRLLITKDHDRDDIFQEVMLKIYSNLESYHHHYAFNTWMYRIARNHCIDSMKKLRPVEVSYDEEIITTEKNNPEQLYLRGELFNEVNKAMNRLTAEERELVFFRINERMKFSDISEITGVNINALKTRMQKIKLILQHELKEYRHG